MTTYRNPPRDPQVDGIIACKRVKQSLAMKMFRKGYYLISGFGEDLRLMDSRFGIYSRNVIERASVYLTIHL